MSIPALINEHRVLIGFVILVGGLMAQNFWPAISARLPAIPWPKFTAAKTTSADPLPVIRYLKKRFKGNAEAEAAIKVIWSLLLEDETP